jgi:DNA-binding CsgD family transcriptional regulator
VGKTRLVWEVLDRVGSEQYVSRRAVATQASRLIPFGALAPLLPAQLPGATDRVNLLRLAAEALVTPAGPRRLLLGVDDAHLLDDLSAALVHQLVRTAAAFVLVVVRSGEPAPDSITALWRGRLAERIDLGVLLPADIEQILVEHLHGPVDGATVQRLCQVSTGNALMLRELVAAGHQAGALRQVEGVWRWQGPWVLAPRLAELIEQRLGRLDAAEREVLELLAYAGPIGPDLLARLVSAEAIEAVEARGLCWVEQQGKRTVVHLGHPIYAEALRAKMPVLRTRRRQRQLAETVEVTGARRLDDCLRIATWRLASGSKVPSPVLLTAAQRAWTLMDLALTEQMARAAFQAGAELDASNILWQVLMLQNRIDEGLQILAGLDKVTANDRECANLALGRAYLYWGNHPTNLHLTVIQDALKKIVDPTIRAELQAFQAAMYTHACQFHIATSLADETLRVDDLPGVVLAHAYFANAMALLFSGNLGQATALFDCVLEALGPAPGIPWLEPIGLIWRCQAQILDGQLDAAAASAEAAYIRGLSKGSNAVIALACLTRGQVCRAQGQLQQSIRWLREGPALLREDRGFVSPIQGELAHAAALLGEVTTAETALAEADATRRHNFVVYHQWLDLARPWIAFARGDRTEAIRQALRNAAALREAGATIYEAVALHDAARLGAAAKVADTLDALVQGCDSALLPLLAAHARALADRDGAALERASTGLESVGALLLAAEAAAEAAHAHRRSGHVDSARRAAARAIALADQCKGATTPTLDSLESPGLTPRQRKIATMAARGMSDEGIAEQLTLSKRTVQNHLAQVYRKLGVHGRTELSDVLTNTRPPHA